MNWYKKVSRPKIKIETTEKGGAVPEEGMWVRCKGCAEIVPKDDLKTQLHVCPRCGFHYRVSSRQRAQLLLDEGTIVEQDSVLDTPDPLRFIDMKPYPQRLQEARKNSRSHEAFLNFEGTLKGIQIQLGCFEFDFMGGSMGQVVGEKVTRLFERSLVKRQPCIVVSASGGARMQEGILSLMQLAKTSVARARLREEGIPFISLLTDPTTGGVAASFAMQGDVILAEPGALIGFAGPRVIEQTMNQKLPEGFQRSEFLLEHGMIDRIVSRQRLRQECASIFHHLGFSPKN